MIEPPKQFDRAAIEGRRGQSAVFDCGLEFGNVIRSRGERGGETTEALEDCTLASGQRERAASVCEQTWKESGGQGGHLERDLGHGKLGDHDRSGRGFDPGRVGRNEADHAGDRRSIDERARSRGRVRTYSGQRGMLSGVFGRACAARVGRSRRCGRSGAITRESKRVGQAVAADLKSRKKCDADDCETRGQKHPRLDDRRAGRLVSGFPSASSCVWNLAGGGADERRTNLCSTRGIAREESAVA